MASPSEQPSNNNNNNGNNENIWSHWADMQEPLLSESHQSSPPRSAGRKPKKKGSPRQQQEEVSVITTASAASRSLAVEEEDPNNPRWLNEEADDEERVPVSNGNLESHNDDDNSDHDDDSSSTSSQNRRNRRNCCLKCICCLCRPIVYILHRPIIVETSEFYQNLKIQIRFIKFLILTLFGILITRVVVVRLEWEHRRGHDDDGLLSFLWETWLYDGNSIIMDCIVFFSIGRLSTQQLPIDHLSWILVVAASSMYTSALPNIAPQWFKYNFSLYELHCKWPWQLWVYVCGVMIPIIIGTVLLHIRHVRRTKQLTSKLIEVIGTVTLLLMPQMFNDHFDFHHYYAGLLFGMNSNIDIWWSRLTMAWCWGQYINGIAIWGRDPILQCAYAQYIATRQHCCSTTNHTNNGTSSSSEDDGFGIITNNDDGGDGGSPSCVWTSTAAGTSLLNDSPPDWWRHCPKPNTTEYYY